MSPLSHRVLEIPVNPSHPRFLDGLEALLQLGLIEDDQVKVWCQQYLTCVVLQPVRQPISKPSIVYRPPQLPPSPETLSRWDRWSQALKEELSVRWLLWLGVFVVIVSSSVVAASQWERFPASGQYGVLWAYTMLFWIAGHWAKRREKLRLTAQTLQIVALFLIPLNFWAMDGFRLWQTLLGLVTISMASVSLGTIAWRSKLLDRVDTLLLLLFGVLHWGSNLVGVPVIAVYVGTLAWFLTARWQSAGNLSSSVLVLGLGTLFVRALGDIETLGFALGIVGWRLTELSIDPTSENSLTRIRSRVGGVLMALGFVVSVSAFPWQALGTIALAWHRLFERVRRFNKRRDLVGLFGVGLIGYIRAIAMLPAEIVQPLLQALGIAGATWSLGSLAGFPYLLAALGLTGWLHERERGSTSRSSDNSLSTFGDSLALGWATFLVVLAWPHTGVRAISLLLSALTLGFVTQTRYPLPSLVYLTQFLGLGSLVSFLYWKIPTLSLWTWGSIALVITLGELLWANLPPYPNTLRSTHPSTRSIVWKKSAWHVGCFVGSVSFILFLIRDRTVASPQDLLWWAIPLALMGIARFGAPLYRTDAGWLSIGSSIVAQGLTYSVPGLRLVSLGIGSLLMLVNVRVLNRSNAATVAVGFGVALTTLALWEAVSLSFDGWLVVGSIVPLALWGLWRWRSLRGGGLSALYLPGTDAWAIGLCVLELAVLTLHSFLLYQRWAVEPSGLAILATAITVGSIVFRQLPRSNNWGMYGIAWGVEVLAVEILGWFGLSLIGLSIVNIGLGLFAQVIGDWWLRRYRDRSIPHAFHTIPLLYGILGLLFRSTAFDSWTGFTTLGFSFVLLGVGRRVATFKPLIYLGLLGISASAYELLTAQTDSLALGDRWVATATLSVGILFVYQTFRPWLSTYLGLSPGTVRALAHAHWLVGTVALFIAAELPANLSVLAFGSGIVLTGYAIVRGRQSSSPQAAELWVYLGVVQGISVLVLEVFNRGWDAFLLPWYGAISALLACFFRILPWERWGWPTRPWHQISRGLPIVAAFFTSATIHSVSLGSIAAFYGLLAVLDRSIRWSYVSLGFVNLLVFQNLSAWGVENSLAWVTPPVILLLYIAGFDPIFRQGQQRQLRHLFRMTILGVFFAVAYGSSHWVFVAVLSLICLLLGLILHVRAFLFVGTAVFSIDLIHQLIVLGATYAFSKGIFGLIFGIILIVVAATFEAKREQIITKIQDWLAVLESWE
ncbi:MAG: hypothetical protein J7641_11755 [Cyanobacteria bacterium SID2]|nr:hypothetical protein [Cyanobacteria bacterium SID2]